VDFSDVQIVHKVAGRVTPKIDFMATLFFSVTIVVQDRYTYVYIAH